MNEPIDPYAPPSANLETAPEQKDTTPLPFFATSVAKVWLYSLASVSLYFLYWHYKQWRAYGDAKHANISPFWRTVFSPFFVFELFPEIVAQTSAKANGMAMAGLYAATTVIANVGSRFNDDIWMVGLIAIFPVATMQAAINDYLRRAYPNADKNDKIGAGGVVLLIVGGILWLLILIGTFLPEPPPG